MLFSCTNIVCRLHKPQYDIHFPQAVLRHIDHITAQFIFCLVNAGRIHKHNLPLIGSIYGLYTVSRGLRLFGGYGYLLPNQTVHQC